MTSSEKQLADYTLKQTNESVIHLQIPMSNAGDRLDVALAALLPDFSRSRIQSWIRQADVRVNGVAASAKTRLHGGEQVEVAIERHPAELPSEPEAIGLNIVYEDASILVIDKPAGLVVHPGSGNWHGTLLNGLLHYVPALTHVPRAGIVHRLDKDTSGLMVVAKTIKAQTMLVRQLQARTVKREYLAVTQGVIALDGRVDAPIGRHPAQRTRMAVQGNGREAVTHYTVLQRFSAHTLIQCRLETGRTHQIRVHMQHIGHPLVGDPAYNRQRAQSGSACARAFTRQALHATRLGLLHPESGEAMQWQREAPEDFAALLACLEQETTKG